MQDILNLEVSSSITHCTVLDTITYTVKVTNSSDSVIENVVLKSLLSQELRFDLGSVEIDYSDVANSSIISGINIGTLIENEEKIVTFSAKVIKKINEKINVSFVCEYSYTDEEMVHNESINSDSVIVLVSNPNLKIQKSVDLLDAKLDDVITYNILLSNVGDTRIESVSLFDTIPKSLELIDGTFTVDGKIINSVELDKGILLGFIEKNGTMEVTYKAKVVSGASGGRIINKSKAKYAYLLENNFRGYKETNEAVARTKMAIANFKQVSINEYLYISPEKPEIIEINDLKAEIKIESQTLIQTASGISREGQKSNDYKLIVHGVLNQTVEYMSDTENQSVNSLYYETPFSTYVILPEDFEIGAKIEVVGFVEDVYFKAVDPTCFFRNIELLIIAKFNLR